MSAPAWIEPFLQWLTSSPLTVDDFRRIEGNISHLRDGLTEFSGNKQFANNVEVLGELISRAQTTLREIVQISGELQMLGNIQVNERPGLEGTGNVTIGGDGILTVGGNASVGGNATVGGTVTAGGDINTPGNILVNGIDTGVGVVECYEMDQPVRTTDAVTHNGVTATGALNIVGLGTRTASSIALTSGSNTALIPAGSYYYSFREPPGTNAAIEVRDSANVWHLIGPSDNNIGGRIDSDGSNVRVRLTTGAAGTLQLIFIG